MVADANSLFDHLQKTGSVRKECRPVNDLLVIKDVVANLVVKMKRSWYQGPTSWHTL